MGVRMRMYIRDKATIYIHTDLRSCTNPHPFIEAFIFDEKKSTLENVLLRIVHRLITETFKKKVGINSTCYDTAYRTT